MAEGINALILPIGADPSQFQKSINDVKNSIKELGSTISATPFNLVSTEQKNNLAQLQNTLKSLTNDLKEFGKAAEPAANSIAGLDKKIKELNAQKITLDAKTSASEIARLTKEIEKLTEKRNNIDALGASVQQIGQIGSTSFKKVQDNSKGARTALTSLSLVAQDLPFGFIAIQNNLPALIQTFGELQRTSGGVKGALGQIGAALTGPAGLFLAFSAVTAGVTFLIQKYGSLGEGIKVLLGASKPLTEAQKSFNKAINETSGSLISEEYRVAALTKTLLNQKAPQKDRLSAYNELNKISPDTIAGISKENALTAEGNLLIQANAEARKQLVRLKIQEAGITNALTTNETELADLRNKLTIADQNYVKSAKELDTANKQSLITGFASKTQQEIALKNFNDNVKIVKELRTKINGLVGEQQGYLNQLDPIANGIAKINYDTQLRIDKLKEEEEALKNLQKTSTKGTPRGTTTEGVSLNNGVITSDIGLLTRVIAANVRLTNAAVDEMRRYREKNTPGALDLMPKKLDKKTSVPMSQELEQQVGATNLELDRLATKFTQTNEALQSAFFQPLSTAFENFFETGKFGFKEFGKAIINTIKQIVAKIIATGIINLLASILVPGGAQAASLVGGAAGAGSGIGRAFGDAFRSVLGLERNRIAAPSFGGVGGGGMQMSGQVVFVQRGSDLVGVLNRTNGTINRVG